MVNYTEKVAHVHAVDTRPSFPLLLRRPGDKANYGQEAKAVDSCSLKINVPSAITLI